MKKRAMYVTMGLIIGSVLGSVTPTLAKSSVMQIQAVFKNIRVCVDGVEMTPRDSAGQVVEPFIYNGTTYLPLRAIGEAVGKNVSWDGSTNTVYLGKSGQTDYLGQQVKAYLKEGTDESDVEMAGQKYYNGVKGSNILSDENKAFYNLNGLYTSMSGVYGMTDISWFDEGSIKIYGDDRLLETFEVKKGMIPKNFIVNVTGVNQLRIEFTASEPCLGSVEFR